MLALNSLNCRPPPNWAFTPAGKAVCSKGWGGRLPLGSLVREPVARLTREMEAPQSWPPLHGPKCRTPVPLVSLVAEPTPSVGDWPRDPCGECPHPAPTCRDSTPASCFLPGALGCLFSAGGGPPPCHLGLLAAQTHSRAFLNTPTYRWTLICLAESVCLWGCNLSRSQSSPVAIIHNGWIFI